MGGTFQFLVAVGSALAGQTNPLVRPPMAAETVTSPVSMVRFSPPVEITIRTKGRNVLRGQMLSFDAETVQIQTRQGKVISYPAKRIHTLRTRDGRFTWKPGSESFEAARKNAESLQTRLPMAGRPPGTVPRRTTPQIPGRKRIGPLVPRPISRPPSGQSLTEPSTRPLPDRAASYSRGHSPGAAGNARSGISHSGSKRHGWIGATLANFSTARQGLSKLPARHTRLLVHRELLSLLRRSLVRGGQTCSRLRWRRPSRSTDEPPAGHVGNRPAVVASARPEILVGRHGPAGRLGRLAAAVVVIDIGNSKGKISWPGVLTNRFWLL